MTEKFHESTLYPPPISNETYHSHPVDLLQMLQSRFSDEFLRQKLVPNLDVLQLDYGCSVGCEFCCEDAPPRSGEFFTLDSLQQFTECYVDVMPPTPSLFCANNPFDYHDGGKDYFDVIDMLIKSGANPAQNYTTMTPDMQTRFLDRSRRDIIAGLGHQVIRISDLGRQIDKDTIRQFKRMLAREGLKRAQIKTATNKYFKSRRPGSAKYRGLSNLGRNYSPNLDFFEAIVAARVKEGVRITPAGQVSGVISVYPTPDNPRGLFEIPIVDDNSTVVRRLDIDNTVNITPLSWSIGQKTAREQDFDNTLQTDELLNAAFLREALFLRRLFGETHGEIGEDGRSKYQDSSEYLPRARKRLEYTKQNFLDADRFAGRLSDDVIKLIPSMQEAVGQIEAQMENMRLKRVESRLHLCYIL